MLHQLGLTTEQLRDLRTAIWTHVDEYDYGMDHDAEYRYMQLLALIYDALGDKYDTRLEYRLEALDDAV